MDAKSKANFINSVAGVQKIPCPNCNTLNDADSIFCAICGTKIGSEQEDTVVSVEDSQMQNNNQVSTENISLDQTMTTSSSSVPAFAPARVSEEKNVNREQSSEQKPKAHIAKPAFQMAEPEPEEVTEEMSIFAEGLPGWDMVPPQVVVRRKSK